MKLAIIFSVFIVLVQGSLFGEFQDAMSSLKSGFQKLITDVVIDVKETIDCTIIAVETALSIGSFVNSPLNQKCKGVVSGKQAKYETIKRDDEGIEFVQSFRPEFTFDGKYETNNLINKVLKHLELINKKNVKSVRSNFENEHNNLSNAVIFLKKEIEKTSLNISEELKFIECERKSTIDCIVKYINLLHSLESKSKNDSELTEVRRILDGACKILSVNVSIEEANDKVNKSLTSLELKSNIELDETVSTIAESTIKKDSELKQIGQVLYGTSKIIRENVSNVNSNNKFNKSLTSLEPKNSNKESDTRFPIGKCNSTKDSGLNEVLRILDSASKILSVNISNENANDKVNKSLTSLEPKSYIKLDETQSTLAESTIKKDSELKENGQVLDGTSKIIRANVSNVNADDNFKKSSTNLKPKSSNKENDTRSLKGISNIKKGSGLNKVYQIFDGASNTLFVNISNGDTNDEVNKSLTSLETKSDYKLDEKQSTITESSIKKDSGLNQIVQVLDGTSKIIRANVSKVIANDEVKKAPTSLKPISSNKETYTRPSTEKSNLSEDFGLNEIHQIFHGASNTLFVNVSNGDTNEEVNKSLTSIEPEFNNKLDETQSTIAERTIKRDSELNQIRQVWDGISKIILTNVRNGDPNNIINKSLTTLESKDYNENNNTLSSTAKMITSGISSNHSNSNLSTVTFKSIFTKALLTTKSTNLNIDNNVSDEIYSTENSPTNDINGDSFDYDSFFGDRSDEESHEEALEEARNLIEDNQRINPTLNEIFANVDQSHSDIFDNQF